MNIKDDQLTDKTVATTDCFQSEVTPVCGFAPTEAETADLAPTPLPDEGSAPVSPMPVPVTPDVPAQAGAPTSADAPAVHADSKDDSSTEPTPAFDKSVEQELPDSDQVRRRLEQVEREAYARGRAEALEVAYYTADIRCGHLENPSADAP